MSKLKHFEKQVTKVFKQVYSMNVLSEEARVLRASVERLLEMLGRYPSASIYSAQFLNALKEENARDPMLALFLTSMYTDLSARLSITRTPIEYIVNENKKNLLLMQERMAEDDLHLNVANHLDPSLLEIGNTNHFYPIVDMCSLLSMFLNKDKIKRFIKEDDKSPRKRQPRVQNRPN